MTTQAERVKIVATEFARLKQFLAALPVDAWSKPSACALWAVRDVVAHLIGAPNLYRDSITRGLQGDTSPAQGFPGPSAFRTDSLEVRRQRATASAQRAIALGERLGNDLLDMFSNAWDQFHHLVASLSPQEWNKPCYHPRGIIPARALVSASVFELAIHGWDIRSVLEPAARLSNDALAIMLEFFSECLHWFFLPDVRLPTPVRYRFAFTGAPSSQWDIVVEGDKAHMESAATASPAHVTFWCDGETFALMMCGRIGFDAAIGATQAIPEGNEALVQVFKTRFQGV